MLNSSKSVKKKNIKFQISIVIHFYVNPIFSFFYLFPNYISKKIILDYWLSKVLTNLK